MESKNIQIEHNLILNDFSTIDFSQIKLPLITIYENPADMPNYFVARIFDRDRPLPYCVRHTNYQELLKLIPEQFINLGKNKLDEPNIVTTFI